jgi:orotidine-5'-phosphate decarboxylase
MRAVRDDIPAEMPILIPGVGAQGGDVAAVVAANREGDSNAFLIAASRSIIYASAGGDFAEAARAAAQALDAEIRAALSAA